MYYMYRVRFSRDTIACVLNCASMLCLLDEIKSNHIVTLRYPRIQDTPRIHSHEYLQKIMSKIGLSTCNLSIVFKNKLHCEYY